MATPLRRTESIVSCGSGVPAVSMMSTPASWTSQSNEDPLVAAADSSTRRVASESSGPVPSPGINVTRWVVIVAVLLAPTRLAQSAWRLSRNGVLPSGREGRHCRDHADRDGECQQHQDVELAAADDQQSGRAGPEHRAQHCADPERDRD